MSLHLHGVRFTMAAAGFPPHRCRRDKQGMAMKPTAQRRDREHRLCLRLTRAPRAAGQVDKNVLSHLGCQRRITMTATQGGRVHQIHLAPDQFGEGRLPTRLGVLTQQFRTVSVGIHLTQ